MDRVKKDKSHLLAFVSRATKKQGHVLRQVFVVFNCFFSFMKLDQVKISNGRGQNQGLVWGGEGGACFCCSWVNESCKMKIVTVGLLGPPISGLGSSCS
jgi:hypothetical protein